MPGRLLWLAVILLLPLGGRAAAQDNVPGVIAKFKAKDPRLARAFDEAYGYVVFPTVGKGAIGIGGARGRGWVYEQGRRIGRASLTQVTIGLQLGGQAYSEVIFFEDKAALDDFTRGNFEFDAQVSAIAVTARAAGDLPYRKGIAVVTMGKGGLMYEASVGGQKFSFKPGDG
jgi:lipid-binding SYLF domain-containing protein